MDGHIKEPQEMSMAWEPDRRFNFLFRLQVDTNSDIPLETPAYFSSYLKPPGSPRGIWS